MSSRDTDDEAAQVYLAAFQSVSGTERVKRAVEMAEVAKSVALAGIRFRRPGLNEDQVALEWLRLVHGDRLVDEMVLADLRAV